MREKEERAAERTRIEAMKSEIELERKRAEEAQQAISSLKAIEQEQEQEQEQSNSSNELNTKPDPAAKATTPAILEKIEVEVPLEIEQEVVVDAANEPVEKTNSTQSQIDLIMETLKNQQQQTETSN
jgi:hypothetical protein